MKILVKAKPGSKRAYIKEEPQGLFVQNDAHGPLRRFTVAVTERAVEGRANGAIISAVADHFGVARSRVRITAGFHGKEKTVEIEKE